MSVAEGSSVDAVEDEECEVAIPGKDRKLNLAEDGKTFNLNTDQICNHIIIFERKIQQNLLSLSPHTCCS